MHRYYNPESFASFKGSADDYTNLYASASVAQSSVDIDLTVGGPALAFAIMENPQYPEGPNGQDLVIAAQEQGLRLNFFTYHSITSGSIIDQAGVRSWMGLAHTHNLQVDANAMTLLICGLHPIGSTIVWRMASYAGKVASSCTLLNSPGHNLCLND